MKLHFFFVLSLSSELVTGTSTAPERTQASDLCIAAVRLNSPHRSMLYCIKQPLQSIHGCNHQQQCSRLQQVLVSPAALGPSKYQQSFMHKNKQYRRGNSHVTAYKLKPTNGSELVVEKVQEANHAPDQPVICLTACLTRMCDKLLCHSRCCLVQ